VLKSVSWEILKLQEHKDADKRSVGSRAAKTLLAIHSQAPHRVTLDQQETPYTHTDDDLLAHAQARKARILTKDNHLISRAKTAGIGFYSLNEVHQKLKLYTQTLLPLLSQEEHVDEGEVHLLHITGHGKQPDDGIAHLNDGQTIIVIGGGDHIGRDVLVRFTSIVKQKNGGKLIFADIYDPERDGPSTNGTSP
jgi:uncharacterized protein YacL